MRLPSSCLRSTAIPRLLRFIIRKAAVSSPIFGGTMRRVSSPPGIFSSLTTSALMSSALELRLGLGEERAVADLEILGAEARVVVLQLRRRERTRIEQALDKF